MTGRGRRAIAVIATALMAIIVTGLIYLRSEMQPVAVTTAPTPTPIPRLLGEYTPAFDFVDPTHGWAIVVDYGPQHRFWIFSTSDGAAHWRLQLTRIAIGGYARIKFFDLRHGYVYAGSLYSTSDGGGTWQEVELPADGPYFDFATAMNGWMIADRLYLTNDGGTSWRVASLPPSAVAYGPTSPAGLAFRPGGEGWLGESLETPSVYLTTDGGSTWQSIPLPFSNPEPGFETYDTSVMLLPGRGVLAVVDSAAGFLDAYVSDDLGATWRLVQAPLPQPEWIADASFLDADHWWVARYGFLYKTSDGGESWTRVLVQPLPGGWNIGPVHVIDVDHGWWTMVATSDSRDNALMMTSDGGADWHAVNMPRPA